MKLIYLLIEERKTNRSFTKVSKKFFFLEYRREDVFIYERTREKKAKRSFFNVLKIAISEEEKLEYMEEMEINLQPKFVPSFDLSHSIFAHGILLNLFRSKTLIHLYPIS